MLQEVRIYSYSPSVQPLLQRLYHMLTHSLIGANPPADKCHDSPTQLSCELNTAFLFSYLLTVIPFLRSHCEMTHALIGSIMHRCRFSLIQFLGLDPFFSLFSLFSYLLCYASRNMLLPPFSGLPSSLELSYCSLCILEVSSWLPGIVLWSIAFPPNEVLCSSGCHSFV
jgi:hypothetical protein